MREDFLKQISTTQHVFSLGDTLFKISYKQYGDPKFWWVIAWFNSKPTDLHCEIGDIIFIPFPLEVLFFKLLEGVKYEQTTSSVFSSSSTPSPPCREGTS